jgi:hypothetical protein
MLKDKRRLVSWCEIKSWLRSAILIAAVSCDEPARQPAPSTPTQAPEPAPPNKRESLIGAWSADGENFVWVIDSTSILFEADMLHHPYRLIGDTLVIDRGDPAGPQKTRVVRLSRDTLVIADVLAGTSETLLRLY